MVQDIFIVELLDLVSSVRTKFEEGKIDYKLLEELYLNYNKIDCIDEFLLKSRELFPKLNCGLATVYLQHLLGGEIINGKYSDQNHTFLLLENQIIDITADQYGGPKVYVGVLKEPWMLN